MDYEQEYAADAATARLFGKLYDALIKSNPAWQDSANSAGQLENIAYGATGNVLDLRPLLSVGGLGSCSVRFV